MPAISLVLSDRAYAAAKQRCPTKHGIGKYLSELVMAEEARAEVRQQVQYQQARARERHVVASVPDEEA